MLIYIIVVIIAMIIGYYKICKEEVVSKKDTYNSHTKTYIDRKGNLRDANTNELRFSHTVGLDADYRITDIKGNLIYSSLREEQEKKMKEDKEKYGDYVTAAPLSRGYWIKYKQAVGSRDYYPAGARDVDLKTHKEMLIRNVLIRNGRFIGSDNIGFTIKMYMDIENGHLLRLTDDENYLTDLCKNKRLPYENPDDIQSFIAEFNQYQDTQDKTNIRKFYFNDIYTDLRKEMSSYKYAVSCSLSNGNISYTQDTLDFIFKTRESIKRKEDKQK